jgi:hypothetical protein
MNVDCALPYDAVLSKHQCPTKPIPRLLRTCFISLIREELAICCVVVRMQ